MSRAETTAAPKDPTASPEEVRRILANRHVCPYCGFQQNDGSDACSRCTMEDSPATRQATKARIGPWYVLQNRNPSAPGMRYSTLLSLLRKGYITPKSVVRGPTTHQLWRFAAHVRGVSREFGLCFSCGASIVRTASICPTCQRSQEPPADPDVLLEPRNNTTSQPQSAPVVVSAPMPEPVVPAAVIDPEPVVSSQTAIEPAKQGSYARRLRELSHKSERSTEESNSSNLPSRRSIAPVFGNGQVVSAMSLARALRENPPRDMLVPSRRKLKISFAAATLLLASGAAVFYARPDYRTVASNWIGKTWTTVRQKVDQFNSPRSSTVAREVPVPGRTPATQPNRMDLSAEIASTELAGWPTTQPTAVGTARSAPPNAPAISPDVALDQARTLWVEAIDAEARHDFASAVRLYEKIRELPSDAWPGALHINLDLARKRLQSSSAR